VPPCRGRWGAGVGLALRTRASVVRCPRGWMPIVSDESRGLFVGNMPKGIAETGGGGGRLAPHRRTAGDARGTVPVVWSVGSSRRFSWRRAHPIGWARVTAGYGR
jgi:hypothetical protein